MDIFERVAVTDFAGDLYRNIVSLRESVDLFDDLTENPAGWQAAAEIEMAVKPYTYGADAPIIHRPFDEAEYFQAIEFPFTAWRASRFSDGAFGVWYGGDSLETTIYETVHHWRSHLLADAGWHQLDDIVTERKVYLVRADGLLFDFRPLVDHFPGLVAKDDYGFTQHVGARLAQNNARGLVNKSARCAGDVFVILQREALRNPRAMCFLTYRTAGDAVLVERQPGQVLMRC